MMSGGGGLRLASVTFFPSSFRPFCLCLPVCQYVSVSLSHFPSPLSFPPLSVCLISLSFPPPFSFSLLFYSIKIPATFFLHILHDTNQDMSIPFAALSAGAIPPHSSLWIFLASLSCLFLYYLCVGFSYFEKRQMGLIIFLLFCRIACKAGRQHLVAVSYLGVSR